jgi:D-inositol-3-phosphate glycosyltransferase
MNLILIGPVHPYRGGIAHYTTMLAQALYKRSSSTHVVSFRRQYPRWLYPGKSDRDPSRNPVKVPAEYLLDPLYPWTWIQAARRIVELKPDCVIFPWWSTFWGPAFFVLAFLIRRRRINVMFVVHNVMPHEPRPWDKILTRLALSQAQQLLVPTEREKNRLLSLLPRSNIILTRLPLFDLYADHRLKQANAKEQLGFPLDKPLALFFGLVRPYKGLKYAMEAVAQLKSENYPLHLLVAGEFWEDLNSYNDLIRQLDLAGYVRLDDRYIPDEEVPVYFSAADVFLAPYINDTQSGAVKIALSFNLPVVISRAITSEELEKNPLHRLYWVEPADAPAIARAVSLCLRENSNYSRSFSSSSNPQEWDSLVDHIERILQS